MNARGNTIARGPQQVRVSPGKVAVILLAFSVSLIFATAVARADIFRWDNGQLIPGTQSVTPGPSAQLDHLDLVFANLRDFNLTSANLAATNLNDARLSRSTLTGADFAGANVARTGFLEVIGLTKDQLYSTASYQEHKLPGVVLNSHNLTGWDFHDQDLSAAWFQSARLTNANFTGARVTDAFFSDTTSRGFTKDQLYSTASYREKNLYNITLDNNNLTGWDFSGQDLTSGLFHNCTLTNANFTGALVEVGGFSNTTGRGFTKEQLYSTASYQRKTLTFMGFVDDDMRGWNFSGQNLTHTHFDESNLSSTDFSRANLAYVAFNRSTLAGADFSQANVAGTMFWQVGLTQGQLYSTASYQAKDLHEIGLLLDDLTAWDFRGQNLSNANLSFATLKNTDFRGAEIAGASFSTTTIPERGFTKEQLYSTASYQRKNLRGINLVSNDLVGWDFSGQDLTGAVFGAATLFNADFTGAAITQANWWDTTSRGFTKEQLYSTASYQQKELQRITVNQNDFSGWNFTSQDLRGSVFDDTLLAEAQFPLADLRSVTGFLPNGPIDLRNTILPDGSINGLTLVAGDRLVVHDFVVNAAVKTNFSVAGDAILELVLGDHGGGAMMSVAAGAQPQLGGTLRLAFGPDTNFADITGATIDLFDWPSTLESTNRFARIETPAGTEWDFSRLYTTGEVTLQAIPEPATLTSISVGALIAALFVWRRRVRAR